MIKRIAILMLVLGGSGGVARAQPSDAQVKKDLGGSGVLKVTLTGKRGTVQGNLDTLNYEYVRGAEILRTTEWPGVKLIVTGDAVYQRGGRGKFTYWKFRVIDNRYEGIPNPSQADIDKVLDTNRADSFGGGVSHIIRKVRKPLVLAKDPQWNWHSPNSVSFLMVGEMEKPTSNTDLEAFAATVEIRLYRDDMKQAWKTFMASPKEQVSLGKTRYTEEELRNLPSLAQQAEEQAAKAQLAKLPKVDIPDFATHDELAAYVHKVFREGPREKAEATVRALLSPESFAPGSTTLLHGRAAEMLKWSLDGAFGDKGSYGLEYCANARTETRGTKNRTYFIGVKPNLISEIVSTRAGGAYKDGVKVGERLMLESIAIRTTDDADTLAWIASFSDRKKLCPED